MQLARLWRISLAASKNTLEATSQHDVQTILHDTLHRRLSNVSFDTES